MGQNIEQCNAIIVSRPGVMQQSLRAALTTVPWLTLTGSAGDGLSALSLIRQQPPDLLILDSNLLEEERVSLIRQVKQGWPTIRCLALVELIRQQQAMLTAGVDAVLPRQTSHQDLHQTLDRLRCRPEPDDEPILTTRTVLLVDDDAELLRLLETIFKRTRTDLTVVTATNGREAWAQCQARLPDLLWTDYQMPDLNGLSLIRLVREAAPELPVVLMTGYGSHLAADFSEMLNIHYLHKPFSPEQAQALIRTVINS